MVVQRGEKVEWSEGAKTIPGDGGGLQGMWRGVVERVKVCKESGKVVGLVQSSERVEG